MRALHSTALANCARTTSDVPISHYMDLAGCVCVCVHNFVRTHFMLI